MFVRVLLLLLFCLDIVCALTSVPGLCLSFLPDPGACDIVNNGTVNPAYTVHGGPILSTSSYPTIYLHLRASDAPPTSLQFTMDFQSNDTTVLQPSALTEPGTLVNNTVFQMHTVGVCQYPGGNAIFTITLTPTGYDIVTVQYTRQCLYPMFTIGSTPGDNDVYYNANGTDVNGWDGWRIASAQQRLYIYLSNPFISPLAVPFYATINNLNPMVVTVTSLQNDTAAYANAGTTLFVINMACLQSKEKKQLGTMMEAQVNVQFQYGWNKFANFTYTIQCGSANALPGLNIASTPQLAASGQWDVAQDGKALGAWASQPGNVFAIDSTYTLPLTMVYQGAAAPVAYTVVADDSTTEFYTLTVLSASTGQLDAGVISISVSITCVKSGTGSSQIEIQVDPYEMVALAFQYSCAAPTLNMGSMPLGLDVVAQNVVSPNWQSYTGINVAASASTSSFFLYLDQSSTVAHQHYQVQMSFDTNVIQNILVADANGGNATFIIPGQANNSGILLTYECASTATGNVQMTINYGWINPFVIRWNKSCAVTSPGGGWGAAGIFFFTVFIISLVLCVFGCGYNYWHEHKRGLSIIPGYNTAHGCYDRMVEPKKWSPQMDTDGGYSSYDDRSGASTYQSNL